MTIDENLPLTGDSLEICEAAETCLLAGKPKSWRVTDFSGSADFGIDFVCQLVVDKQVRNTFKIQLKGTRTPKLNTDC